MAKSFISGKQFQKRPNLEDLAFIKAEWQPCYVLDVCFYFFRMLKGRKKGQLTIDFISGGISWFKEQDSHLKVNFDNCDNFFVIIQNPL
jgi:hypothetical protein